MDEDAEIRKAIKRLIMEAQVPDNLDNIRKAKASLYELLDLKEEA